MAGNAPLIIYIAMLLSMVSSITVSATHIGLFASTGCYSHDVMMRHFADRLTSIGHRVTLIQIRVYDFNPELNATSDASPPWRHVSYDACGNESMTTLRRLQRQMWTNLVPFDANSWNMDGVNSLNQLHNHHIKACFNALRDQTFMEEVRLLRLDLLATDYVLNECALRFSTLLDVNLVYFSNYPILSSYAVDLGIPSNPSFVPSVIGYETTNMQFRKRLFNSVLYFMLWSTRQWFDFDANRVFKRALGRRFYKKAKSKTANRTVLAFATPFEFLADAPRPIARNLHYFGCDHCFDAAEAPSKTTFEMLNISVADAVVLVSFGTVTKGDQIPVIQLQRLIRTMAQFPVYTFVWQLDLSRDDFKERVLKPVGLQMPANVHLFPWIPMKQLLRDPSIRLSINHGGISTSFEALHKEIPILGIALQGDQGYNLRRLAEKGVAEMVAVTELTDDILCQKLASSTRDNWLKHRNASSKLARMIRDYRKLHKQAPSEFWVSWAARHFGRSRSAELAGLKARRFLTLRYPSNWFIYYSLDALSAFGFGFAICIWIIWVIFSVSKSRCASKVKL